LRVPPVSQLKQICRPHNRKQDWFIRLVARPISIYITKILLYTPVSANLVTLMMLIFGILAGISFTLDNYWASLAGGLILILNIILDCVDGEIARFRNTSSLQGAYLDRLIHIIVSPFIFIGITFGAYTSSGDSRIFIGGFSAALFILLKRLSFLERRSILTDEGAQKPEPGIISSLATNQHGESWQHKILRKLSGKIPDIAYDENLMILLILLGAILGRLDIVLIIYGCLLPLRWILQIIFDFRFGFH
jgi:hypothetical protein